MTNGVELREVNMLKYRGIAMDRLNKTNDRKTRWYRSYQEAHNRAEKLAGKNNDRYSIVIQMKGECI